MNISRSGLSLIGYPVNSQGAAVVNTGIREVAPYAFCGCKGVTDILIPHGVELIGPCAFWDCRSLRTIFIPSSVKEVRADIFGDHHSSHPISLYFEGEISRDVVDDLKYRLGAFTTVTFNVPEEWYRQFIIKKGAVISA